MNHYPLFPDRKTLSLDGGWDFVWLGGDIDVSGIDPSKLAYNEVMAVPGVFDTCPQHYGKRGVVAYRKRFTFPAGKDERLRLCIGGMGLFSRIFWDGKHVSDYQIPYSSIAYDLPAVGGDHELIIVIDNRYDKNIVPLFRPHFDLYGFGGIYRSVSVQSLPKSAVKRVQIKTLSTAHGSVRLRILLDGDIPVEVRGSYRFDSGADIAFREKPVNGMIDITADVPGFKLWSPEQPHLHTVTVTTGDDCIVERFGIRTVETKDQKILLNGKQVFLKGVNRHESHPELGPVQNVQLMMDDLHLLRDLGCNFVRCVHYPQDQAFFDLCDEVGMLAWQESMGWNDTENDAKDQLYFDLQVKQTQLMVENSIDHPSIILWGFLNECCSDTAGGKALYGKLAETIRAVDPALLVTFASSKHERDICLEFADVIAMNIYPGWIGGHKDYTTPSIKWIEGRVNSIAEFTNREDLRHKPFILGEIGACGLYGCHDRADAQWSEEFQAGYFAEAIRAVFANPRYSGIALWQFFDTRSFVNGGEVRVKPRGFNCAGLLDEYRRPKMAYDAVKKMYARR